MPVSLGMPLPDFVLNLKEEQKQILRCAYPNFVGAPSCSAQDDTVSVIKRDGGEAEAGGVGFALSHPCRDETASWMGHPISC